MLRLRESQSRQTLPQGGRAYAVELSQGASNAALMDHPGFRVSLSPQRMSATIPISIFRSLDLQDELCRAVFSLSLEVFPGEHHEIFWFQGQAAVDCQE
jgi:hypothetical protein